eukprot:gnl/MRDRNA2_/MRDRNA2_33640_c0_seq1.p1 gnl/MRDRNA2_/MRDRNA2_33640_c0~~gnl/MRDRNA2_/MRDRNA2_33640_c0_seq1.p1  ORF type:complete len:131 (+),score=26.12 gnl/MRDRNA2_/MRDRNA2_33640_c0_seq1:80-472(+)
MLRVFRPAARFLQTARSMPGSANRFFSALTDEVDTMIKENPCVLIAKANCKFSRRAKDMLASANCKIVDLDKEYSDSDASEIQDHMEQKTGGRSVPRVFIGGECIGGADELKGLQRKNDLKPRLEKAGAL